MIMESRRGGQSGDVFSSQDVSRRRSFNKKPPRVSWLPTVPSWEKTFCKVVGSFDWEKLVDMKKFVHLYDNVLKWDDSEGEEAFHNAKKRFLAKMHGSPCDVSMPDPDLYIDEIDWDSTVDSELLLDLEYGSVVPDMTENNEPVVIFGDSLLCNQGFSSTGWGECEEEIKKPNDSSCNNGWEQARKSRGTAKENGWEQARKSRGTAKENGQVDFGNNAGVPNVDGGATRATGWPDSWENSWNHTENQKMGSKNHKSVDNYGACGTWDVSNGKKNHGGRLMSRYRTSRLYTNEQQGSYAWRSGNDRKKATFASENSPTELWNLTSLCGPVSYHASGNGGQAWNLEKPVS